MLKNYAIIVAGGSGSRMKSDIPKQFLLLAGKPILLHTLETFLTIENIQIVLVLPDKDISYWVNEVLPVYTDSPVFENKKITVVTGGQTRFQSVKNGLESITCKEFLVAIHDGVRPIISKEIIEKSFHEAEVHKAVAVCVAPKDSVRMVTENKENHALDRARIRLMQTPQTFDGTLLRAAFQLPEQPFYTDDASVVEFYGHAIYLIEDSYENIKVTTPEDIYIAERLLKNKSLA